MPTPKSKSLRAELLARDIMRKQIVTVPVTAPLSEVERILSDARVSGAPVVDRRGTIVGVVSMRDLIERYTEDPDSRPRRGRGSFYVSTEELGDEDLEAFETPQESEETAADIMTASVNSIDADAPLPVVARHMVELQIHRILVTEGRKTIGLISTMDVLRGIAGIVKSAASPKSGSAGAAKRKSAGGGKKKTAKR